MNVISVDAQSCAQMYQQEKLTNGLSLYLTNLSRGRDMTPRSWLYEKYDPSVILATWINLMQEANGKHPLGEEFSSFDLKQVEKFGPQGGIPPIDSKECWNVIEPLYTSSEYDDPLALKEWFPKAREFAERLFDEDLLRGSPLSYERVVGHMRMRDTLSTNSGFPRFTKRKKTFPMEIDDARSLAAFQYPAVVLLRYYYGKLRPVWMFPMSMNLIEASFQVEIQDVIKLSDMAKPYCAREYVSPWAGFEWVKYYMTIQWKRNTTAIGGDTTKMDAHMRPAQMRLFFEIVKWYFQKRYWELLERSIMHVTDIDLLWSKEGNDIKIIQGVHGLASGSCWTQLSETVLQMFMAYVLGVPGGQGIGDDFFWVKDMTAEDLVDHLGKFGLPANPAKQSVGKESLTFLQRYYHQGFFSRENPRTVMGAYYPTIRALGSMVYPEKFHSPEFWDSNMFCLRNYMIMENCVDDPCFDVFVKYVVKGQKDMIPFAKKVMAESAKEGSRKGRFTHFEKQLNSQARNLPGLWPSYNQEKQLTPLHDFQSIVLAAKL